MYVFSILYIDVGDIDVGDKWVLVTLSWWQFLNVSDGISILVTSFGYWFPTLKFKNGGYWWQKRQKPSPTSQSCRQHISFPTSDVAAGNWDPSLFIYTKKGFTINSIWACCWRYPIYSYNWLNGLCGNSKAWNRCHSSRCRPCRQNCRYCN